MCLSAASHEVLQHEGWDVSLPGLECSLSSHTNVADVFLCTVQLHRLVWTICSQYMQVSYFSICVQQSHLFDIHSQSLDLSWSYHQVISASMVSSECEVNLRPCLESHEGHTCSMCACFNSSGLMSNEAVPTDHSWAFTVRMPCPAVACRHA